jgi:CheY-like chemotaxis protein
MAKKILVVDDEPSVVRVIEARLKANDYVVSTASNGQEALTKLPTVKPDLILLDVLMPVMGGFDFLKAIKKDPFSADIPILVITARGAMKDVFQGMGADDFMAKPFESEDLVRRVKNLLIKKALILSNDPYTLDKVKFEFTKYDWQLHIASDEAALLKMAWETKYSMIIVHLPWFHKEPEDFASMLKRFKVTTPKVILYCDVNVQGTDGPTVAPINAIRMKWAAAGFKLFFDTRLVDKSLADLIKSCIGIL